jgi:hypothetical protein
LLRQLNGARLYGYQWINRSKKWTLSIYTIGCKLDPNYYLCDEVKRMKSEWVSEWVKKSIYLIYSQRKYLTRQLKRLYVEARFEPGQWKVHCTIFFSSLSSLLNFIFLKLNEMKKKIAFNYIIFVSERLFIGQVLCSRLRTNEHRKSMRLSKLGSPLFFSITSLRCRFVLIWNIRNACWKRKKNHRSIVYNDEDVWCILNYFLWSCEEKLWTEKIKFLIHKTKLNKKNKIGRF